MRQLRITGPAQADLADAYDNLTAEAGKSVAQQLAQQLDAAFKQLIVMPHFGKSVDKYAPRLREMRSGRHRIFYRPLSDGIEVIRILHERRDIRPEMSH